MESESPPELPGSVRAAVLRGIVIGVACWAGVLASWAALGFLRLHVSFFWGHETLLFLATLLAIPAALASGVWMLVERGPRRHPALPWACLVFALIMGATFRLPVRLHWTVQRHVLAAIPERSAPLIAAIERYAAERGWPPHEIGDLVPDYLPSVPSTGLGAFPEYQIWLPDRTGESTLGNPYMLRISIPQGLIDFSEMIYLPNQDYPQEDSRGRLERIGTWAFVHE